MPIMHMNLKQKYFLLKTAISNSQKSKDQKLVHREVLGEGLEDRERRREGEGAEGGK